MRKPKYNYQYIDANYRTMSNRELEVESGIPYKTIIQYKRQKRYTMDKEAYRKAHRRPHKPAKTIPATLKRRAHDLSEYLCEWFAAFCAYRYSTIIYNPNTMRIRKAYRHRNRDEVKMKCKKGEQVASVMEYITALRTKSLNNRPLEGERQ